MVETKVNLEKLKQVSEVLGGSPASRNYSLIEKLNARLFSVFRATPAEKKWLEDEKENNWMVMAPGMQELAASFRSAHAYTKTIILPLDSLQKSLRSAFEDDMELPKATRDRYSRKLSEVSELVSKEDPVTESYLSAASKSLEYGNVLAALNSLNAALSAIRR